MSLALKKTVASVEEYLEYERASEERHEYLDGVIFMMAGESGAHADISTNLIVSLGNQLKNTDCRVRAKDTKVRSGFVSPKNLTKGMFSYPDVVVVCGTVEHHDKHRDIITNPTVIIEVLSPTTEAFDRDEKFARYRTSNPTLQDYILIAQDKPLVEHRVRQATGNWLLLEHRNLYGDFKIESINCTLNVSDIYDRIDVEDITDDQFI